MCMGGEALLPVSRLPSPPQVMCVARKICAAGLRTFAVLSLVVYDFFLSFFLFFTGKAHLKKYFYCSIVALQYCVTVCCTGR